MYYFIDHILKNEDIKTLKEKTATEIYNLSLENMPLSLQCDLEQLSKDNIQYFLTKKYELIRQYKTQGMVDFRNPNYFFLHDFILYKMHIHINCILNILDNQYKEELEEEEKKILKEKIQIFYKELFDMQEEIIFHYAVIDELIEEYPNLESLQKAKEKLLYYFHKTCIIAMIDRERKILVNHSKHIDYDKIVLNYQKKYNTKKSLINYIKKNHETAISFDRHSLDRIGKIEYEIDLIYEDYKEMNNYIEFHMKEFLEKEKSYDNQNYLEEINNIIEEYQYFDKNYELINYEIETLYQKILYLKYQYLKNNPVLISDSLLINDYKSEELYQKLIEEDLEEYHNSNDLVKENIYNFLINYKEDICKNKYLLSLLLFDSNNLLYWFNQKVNLKEVLKDNYINFKMNCIMNKIIIKEEMSLETYIYLNSLKDTNYSYLINAHKELIKRNGINRPLLTGIKKIDFDSEIGDKLFALLCLRKNEITISNDVELFQTYRIYDGLLSSLKFQKGTKIINIKNVTPTNYITITVPSSVNALNINFKSRIETIVINNYRLSSLLCEDSIFIKELLEAYYEKVSWLKPNQKRTIILSGIPKRNDRAIYILSPNKDATKTIIARDKNKEIKYVLKPERRKVNYHYYNIIEYEKKEIIRDKKREIERLFSNQNIVNLKKIWNTPPKGVGRCLKIK